MAFKKQTKCIPTQRLFIDCNYWKWHQLYRKSNTNKSREQMGIKSGWKMEELVCSCQPESPSKMLRRWETCRCSTETSSQKSQSWAWGDLSFPRSSQLPAVAELGFDDEQTPFEVLELFLESHPLKSSPHPSSQLFSEALYPLRHFVFSLWGWFTLLLLEHNSQPQPPALAVVALGRHTLMLLATGCFCERLQLWAPRFKCVKLLSKNCQLFNLCSFQLWSCVF